jgi:hypothetical protein
MMNDAGASMGGWAGDGMWIWVVAGTLVIVLAVAVTLKLFRK